MRSFASDNAAGVHPEVLAALTRVQGGHAPAYGDDEHTARALGAVRAAFGDDARAYFVWGGTAANVLGLRCLCDSYHAVLCAAEAHLQVDECGAPERFLGTKLLLLAPEHGKVAPETLEAAIRGRGVVHHVQPRVLSVTQATECGTVYTPAELSALAAACRRHDLYFHMDGARLANAAASLGVGLGALTRDVGVDVLSFGATKNGALGAEAVVFLRPGLDAAMGFHRKQGMQLASKMRFLAAQIEARLTDELWRRLAERANRRARQLADGVASLPEVELVHPVEANAVFARLPARIVPDLAARFGFYVWEEDEARPVVRWMCAYDHEADDVTAFLTALRAALGAQT